MDKKVDGPLSQCPQCRKCFTLLRSRGRMPGSESSANRHNEEPEELRNLGRQCRHCGVIDNALFKDYINNHLSQPCFTCLSCGKEFQMRFFGTGEGRRLVHTSFQETRLPRRRRKQPGVPSEPVPISASRSSVVDFGDDDDDGSIDIQPCDAAGTETSPLHSEMSDEDEEFVKYIEGELTEEENMEAHPSSWTAKGDDGNFALPPPWNREVFDYLLEFL